MLTGFEPNNRGGKVLQIHLLIMRHMGLPLLVLHMAGDEGFEL